MDVDQMVERLRRVVPHRLPSEPQPGDRVMVRWACPSWPGEYLVRVKKRVSNGVYAAELASADKSFGTWNFSTEVDEWRWPTEKDVRLPRPGDFLFIRWGDWDQEEYYVEVSVDEVGELTVIDGHGDESFGEYTFDPRKDCWRWPDDGETNATKRESRLVEQPKEEPGESESAVESAMESALEESEIRPTVMPGSIILVKWEGWEKWYLVEVVEKPTGLAVVSASRDPSFGEWVSSRTLSLVC